MSEKQLSKYSFIFGVMLLSMPILKGKEEVQSLETRIIRKEINKNIEEIRIFQSRELL